MIQEILKAHILANTSIAKIFFDTGTTDDNILILWIYGGQYTSIGQKPAIQIKYKSTDKSLALTKITEIYDLLYPKDQFKRSRTVQTATTQMNIEAVQQPFFNDKDAQDRYEYVFNILITLDR